MGLHVLVLAGGSGTRLWPLSRQARPKHLLPLGPGGKTLLRATLERVLGIGDTVSVLTATEQAEPCLAEMATVGLDADSIIAEPVARGTGPALGLAVSTIARRDPAPLIASVHADARVSVADTGAYRAALLASAGWALTTGGLATVGIRPAFASTGLGYIELGQPLEASAWTDPSSRSEASWAAEARALPAFHALGFAEKPSADVAEDFVAGGKHLWNLGLFAWPGDFFLHELRRADASLAAALERVVDARLRTDERLAGELYSQLRNVAVEPLVFERTRQLAVVDGRFSWSDLGSWADLQEAAVAAGEADAEGNVLSGDVMSVASHDCLVEARGGRLVAVAGADGLIVVDTPDALLIVPAKEAQRVKDVVERLKAAGRGELL